MRIASSYATGIKKQGIFVRKYTRFLSAHRKTKINLFLLISSVINVLEMFIVSIIFKAFVQRCLFLMFPLTSFRD